jgi:hypothetical protein
MLFVKQDSKFLVCNKFDSKGNILLEGSQNSDGVISLFCVRPTYVTSKGSLCTTDGKVKKKEGSQSAGF